MTSTPPNAPAPVVERGTAHVSFALDVGLAIRLEEAAALLRGSAGRLRLVDPKRTPSSFSFEPEPLLLRRACDPQRVGGIESAAEATISAFDFGGVVVAYRFPLRGPLDALVGFAADLYENATLAGHARALVEDLLRAIAPAVHRPTLDPLVEDYCLYQVESFAEPIEPAALVDAHGGLLARILRGEAGPLSDSERRDALETRLAYRPDELLVVDWNAAFALDRDVDAVAAVLAFANLELLELRLLDGVLDQLLDDAYEALHARPTVRSLLGIGSGSAAMRRVGRLQVDAAVLFEQVSNAIKLLGDQFLARVYRQAATRFHTPAWDASILRKLSTIEQIHSRRQEEQGTRRMELLEWIIILLIAIEVVKGFMP